MKKLLSILAAVATMGLSMTTGAAFAADAAPAAAPMTQQSKMKTCNVDAKSK
jgi:Ni/Co efflux regulator RcnB